MKLFAKLFAAATIAATSVSAPALAGESEKGFYATVGAGVTMPQDTDSDATISGTKVTGDYKNDGGFFGEIGLGYNFGNDLRTEFTYANGSVETNKVKVCTTSCVDVDLSGADATVESFLVSLYKDFQTNGKFTPFIGGGIGFSELETKAATATIGGTTYNLESGSKSGLFTYTLAVGTSYEVSDSTDIYGKLTYLGTEDYSVGVENVDGLGSFVINLGARFSF